MSNFSYLFKKIVFFVLISFTCYSQKTNPPLFVSKVYNDMFSVMDNGQTIKPRIFLSDDNLEVVSFHPLENEIKIGKKFVTLLRNFKKDSCNALAHVLGHELAHVLLQQNDFIKNVGSGYASEGFNTKLKKIQRTLKDSVFERQADEYSTLYAHIAGYKTSQIGEQLLDSIYHDFNLKDSELTKYPTLEDRKKIVRLTSQKMKVLCLLYEHAFYALIHKNFDLSIAMYSAIIQEKFTSREIYNNLALAYTLKGLESLSADEYNNDYPFEFEFETNLKTLERSLDGDDPDVFLEEAIRLYDLAILKNKSYYKTYLNKAITEVLLKRYDDARISLSYLIKSKDSFLLGKKEILEIIIERMNGSKEEALKKMNFIALNQTIAQNNVNKWTEVNKEKTVIPQGTLFSILFNSCNLKASLPEAKIAGDKMLSKLTDKNKFKLKLLEDNDFKIYFWLYTLGESKPSIEICELKNNSNMPINLETIKKDNKKIFITQDRKIFIFDDGVIIFKDDIIEKIIKIR